MTEDDQRELAKVIDEQRASIKRILLINERMAGRIPLYFILGLAMGFYAGLTI